MIKNEQNRLIYFQFNQLSQEHNIKHFISTRINNIDTEFNLSLYDTDKSKHVINNRQRLAKSVNIPFENFIFQQQIHSKNVRIITKTDIGMGTLAYPDGISDNDAMITNESGVCKCNGWRLCPVNIL